MDEFSSGCASEDILFFVFHQNVQCLSNKIESFDVFFEDMYCDIFCVSEHWFSGDLIHSLQLNSFYLVDHFSRVNHVHGGVAIFSRADLLVEPIADIRNFSVELHFECVAGRVSRDGVRSIVLALYRSDSGSRDVFLDRLNLTLDRLSRYRDHSVIICGDFNYDFLEMSTELRKLLDLFNSYYIAPTIRKPTRGKRCLDNICVSGDVHVHDSEVVHNGLSDHSGQLLSVTGKKIATQLKSYYRQLNNAQNIRHFQDLLASEAWEGVLTCRDVDHQYENFETIISRHFNLAFPLKCRRINERVNVSPPWITQGIRISSARLRDLFLLGTGGDGDVLQLYRTYKTIYTRVLKVAKKMYFNGVLAGASNKSKAAWGIINGGNRKCRGRIELEVDGHVVTDGSECADHFNSFFVSVADRCMAPCGASCLSGVKRNDNSLFFVPVLECEVESEIRQLRVSDSAGYDGITSRILKRCVHELSVPLVAIINNSLGSGRFPGSLRRARVIPLYKKNNPANVENYRPLSILSTFSKILEKIVSRQLVNFFEKYDLFNEHQHGFRKGHSTSTAIIEFLNSLYHCLDRGRSCLGIFLDLSKAFDLVDHARLLDKLDYYGVRGVPLQWFRTYLCNRPQSVEVNDAVSGTLMTSRGVPQGSVLGPLLYIIYTGDIAMEGLIMYADDTSLLVHSDDVGAACRTAGDLMVSVGSYFTENGLLLNHDKSVVINFSLSPIGNETNCVISCDEGEIRSVERAKFLGVILDRRLKWDQHVDELSGRIATECYKLRKLRDMVDLQTLRMYYFAHVHSLVSYGVIGWGSSSELSRVLVLQKRAIRAMLGLGGVTSCRQRFSQLGIMTVVSLYIFQLLLYIKNNLSAATGLCDKHMYHTRNSSVLEFPAHRTTAFERSPYYMAIRCFNKLPDRIRSLEHRRYKSELRCLLITKPYYSCLEFFNDSFK